MSVVICKKSAEEAFEVWKSGKSSGTAKKYVFWEEISNSCKELIGKPYLKGSSIYKYVREKSAFTDEAGDIILRAARAINIQLRYEGQLPVREIIEPELLNLSAYLVKLDRDIAVLMPNHIEPNQSHTLSISLKLDHGQRSIEFGTNPTAPSLYAADLKIRQGSVQIHTAHAGIAREDSPQVYKIRESGDPRDLRSMSWVVDDLPEVSGSIEADLGVWNGKFASTDIVTFTVAQEHLELKHFRHKYPEISAPEEFNTSITPEVAEAIKVQIEKVLSEAFVEQTHRRLQLATVPLFPNLDDG